jgi:hypothetical protein
MVHVLAFFDDEFRAHCVDIFVRENGTLGFEEFRRDRRGFTAGTPPLLCGLR